MDPIPIIFAALALGFLVLIILAIRKMAAGPAEDDSESKDAAGKAETTKTDGKKPPAKVEVAKKPPAKVEARKPPAVDTAEEKKRLKKGLAKTKDGNCSICGGTQHWWKTCPQLKGKGKTYALWDDWSDWHTGYFNVSLAMVYSLAKSHPAKAVLDTGATQTAGSATAVWSLIEHLQAMDPAMRDEVDRTHRPWLHFGDGGWLRAQAKIWLQTALGQIGIFVLQAPGVPILIGSDCCESWGILISYKRNGATFENVEGMPKICLERSSSGHRLIDLTAALVWTAAIKSPSS